MEQTLPENLQLGQLVANALSEIERLGYSRRSRNRYRAIWEHLIEFSRRNQLEDKISADLAARFLEEYGVRGAAMDEPGNGWRRHLLFGLKVLVDFAKNGRIERALADIQAIHLHPAMQITLRDYEQYCTDRLHLRGTSLRLRTAELTLFLHFLHSTKARKLTEIQTVDLSEFISTRDHLQPKSVARVVSDLRCFLRFLTMRGILQQDLSAQLPKIRVRKDATIPSVWHPELVVGLLGAVDRSSAKGKRDYAILLLACRLGLRAGDIRTLKLEDLHWDESTIKITQAKTDEPLSLPLTKESGSPDRLLEVRSASNDPPKGIPQSATAIFSFCRKPSLPHCHVSAPPVGDYLSEFAKTGHPFSSPYVGDSAPGERHAVCDDCGDLGAYQFGINPYLRKSGYRSFKKLYAA